MVATVPHDSGKTAVCDPSKITSYAEHFNIKFQKLEKFDVLRLASMVKDQWFIQSLCELNGSVIRMGFVQGTYPWRKDDKSDQLYFCLEGEFLIDLDDGTISLQSHQGIVIPKGQPYRPRAPTRCLLLMQD